MTEPVPVNGLPSSDQSFWSFPRSPFCVKLLGMGSKDKGKKESRKRRSPNRNQSLAASARYLPQPRPSSAAFALYAQRALRVSEGPFCIWAHPVPILVFRLPKEKRSAFNSSPHLERITSSSRGTNVPFRRSAFFLALSMFSVILQGRTANSPTRSTDPGAIAGRSASATGRTRRTPCHWPCPRRRRRAGAGSHWGHPVV